MIICCIDTKKWIWRVYATWWVGLGLWGRCVSYARQQISYHMHAKTAYYMYAKQVRIIYMAKSVFTYQMSFRFYLAYYLYALSWDRVGFSYDHTDGISNSKSEMRESVKRREQCSLLNEWRGPLLWPSESVHYMSSHTHVGFTSHVCSFLSHHDPLTVLHGWLSNNGTRIQYLAYCTVGCLLNELDDEILEQ